MTGIKRVDPRRPYRITPAGLRRIVLGNLGGAGSLAAEHGQSQATAPKPFRTQQTPQRWYMAIAHTSRGRLDAHAREAFAAAAILAAPATGVIGVILGELNDDAGELAADRIAVVQDFDAGRFQPARELAVIEALIAKYEPEHIFFPDNALGDGDLGRRLIASQNFDAATHGVEIDHNHVAVAWSGGSARAEMPLPRVILLEAGAVDPVLPFVGAGEPVPVSEMLGVPVTKEFTRDLGIETMQAADIALEEADFIVSGGNGVQNVATLKALAKALGAAVGASRVAVDDGRFQRDRQIGASGKTVSASAYIAVGISGAVQHLQGIKDCRHVIAFNRDAGAPIAKRADLTVIGDAEDVMQALITRVSQARNQREIVEAKS